MTEYIEREAALRFQDELEPVLCMPPDKSGVFSATRDAELVSYIQNIPAADVKKPLKGWWGKYGNTDYFFCSCCCHIFEKKTAFCPDCGAEMREAR